MKKRTSHKRSSTFSSTTSGTAFLFIILLAIWVFFTLTNLNWDRLFTELASPPTHRDTGETLSSFEVWIKHITTGFLSKRNLTNLFKDMSVIAIAATGMVFVIISGEIDLSVGSMMGLLGGVAAIMSARYGLDPWVIVPTVILIGFCIGAFNGWLIAYREIPSFIVTLAGMLAFRGLLTRLTEAQSIRLEGNFFKDVLGNGNLPNLLSIILWILFALLISYKLFGHRIKSTLNTLKAKEPSTLSLQENTLSKRALLSLFFLIIGSFLLVLYLNSHRGVPNPVFIMILFTIGMYWVSQHTLYGRHTYAVGGNLEAARLSGIPIRKVKMMVFAINGAIVAVASLLLVSRLNTSSPTAGVSYELYTIAACFVGGTSMRGGIGSVLGVILGALIMESLRNGMRFSGVDAAWQEVIMGSILLLAVYLDIARRNGDILKIKQRLHLVSSS